MANKIILKKSSTASKVPLSTDLDIGEMAVNLVDQKLYTKNASGTVILIGNSTLGTVTSVSGLGTVNGLTLTGSVTSSGSLTLGGTLDLSSPPAIGGATPNSGSFTSITDSGNLTFTGTGNRITGDMSNATIANRLAFQTSSANSTTVLTVIPNGTATTAQINIESDPTLTNGNFGQLLSTGTEVSIRSSSRGTGSYVPLIMYTGGSERLRIDTSGNVSIGSTTAVRKLDVRNTSADYQLHLGDTASTTLGYELGRENTGGLFKFYGNQTGATGYIFSGVDGERMRIDTSGNLGIGQSSPVAISGYTIQTINNGTTGSGVYLQSAGTDRGRFLANSTATYIGARNGLPLVLESNATEAMRIDSSGNVQIGTTSGASKFTVYGGSLGSTSGDVKYLQSLSINSANADAFEILYSRTAADNGWTTANLILRRNVDGSAIQPAITLAGDNSLRLSTSGSERMRIDSSGNVGIGTSSPASKLNVSGGNVTVSPGYGIAYSGDQTRIMTPEDNVSGALIRYASGAICRFLNGSTESMRIDSSGNVQIGGTGGSGRLNVNGGTIQHTVSTINSQGFIQTNAENGTYFNFSSNGSAGFGVSNWANSVVLEAVTLGAATTSASSGLVLGTYSPGSSIIFQTNGRTEKMRLDTSGNLLVGTTSATGSGKVVMAFASGANGYSAVSTDNTSNASFMQMYANGAFCGNITRVGTTSAVNYGSASDYRLKENIQPITSALDKVLSLNPVTYDWKSGGSSEGFIAHELAEVCPYAVNGEKDAVFEDGSINPQSIDQSKLVATLTKAIQEQQAMIEQLTTRLNALEGK